MAGIRLKSERLMICPVRVGGHLVISYMVEHAQDYAPRRDFTENTATSVYSDTAHLDVVGKFHPESPACVPVNQITFVGGICESFVSDYGMSQNLEIEGSEVE